MSFRKLTAKKKGWKCGVCSTGSILTRSKSVSDEPNSENPESNDMKREIQDIKSTLKVICAKLNDLGDLKTQLKNVEETRDFVSKQYDDFVDKFNRSNEAVETLTRQVKLLVEQNSRKDKIITELSSRLNKLEQQARKRMVEIHELPKEPNENSMQIVQDIGRQIGVSLVPEDIESVYRIPLRSVGKVSPLIIEFQTGVKREEFMKIRSFVVKEGKHTGKKIYFNESLTAYYRKLLYTAKQIAKDNEYKYIWYKNEKILVKKNDKSPVIQINTEVDLVKIGRE